MPQRTTYREDFKSNVKKFISETGVSISQIVNHKSVSYPNSTKIKEFVFQDKGTLTDVTMDKIMNFISNYKR